MLEHAISNVRAQFLVIRVKDFVINNLCQDAALIGKSAKFIEFPQTKNGGFLDEDMLAGVQCEPCRFKMAIVGRGDTDDIDAVIQELGKRFDVEMSLLVTVDPANESPRGLLFSRDNGQIGDHAIMRGRDKSEQVDRVLTFTGQSLKGPSGSVALLKFGDTARDRGQSKDVSAAGRAQGIALKYGRGRVVVMGEAAQLSAQVYGDPPEPMGMNVPGCDNRKMALNVVHWLSGLTD